MCVCVCSRLSVGDFKCGSRVVLLRLFPIQRVDQQNGSLTRIACFEVLDDFHFGMIIIAYQTHYNIPVVACYMKNDGCFSRRVAAGLNNLIVLLAHDPSLSTGKHISPERVSGIVFSFSEIGQLTIKWIHRIFSVEKRDQERKNFELNDKMLKMYNL